MTRPTSASTQAESQKCPRRLKTHSPTECFIYAKIGACGMSMNRNRFTGTGTLRRNAGGSNGHTARTVTTSTSQKNTIEFQYMVERAHSFCGDDGMPRPQPV